MLFTSRRAGETWRADFGPLLMWNRYGCTSEAPSQDVALLRRRAA